MKLELTKKQLLDLQFSLCLAMHETETDTKMNKGVQERLLKRYAETYDVLGKQLKLIKINDTWKEVLKNVR